MKFLDRRQTKLTKINKTVELENNPTTQGMIRVVGHLVTVEEK